MKKISKLFLISALILSSCSKFDDTALWNAINKNSTDIAILMEKCNQMNSDILNLKELVTALQNNDYITSCTPLADNSGYTIVFHSGKAIIIKNGLNGKDGEDGENGKDGSTPIISVKKDIDGNYYWTLNGEWLTDKEGQRIKASGSDGKDGITPKFKIENGKWYISLDNGFSWTVLGKATGDNGKDGKSFFRSITVTDTHVIFILEDGTEFSLPFPPSCVAKTGDVSNIFSDSAEIHGWCYQEPQPGMSVIYGIEYSATDLTTNAISMTASEKDENNKFCCQPDLLPDTQYYYRAFVLFGGTKTYGEVKTFRTKQLEDGITLKQLMIGCKTAIFSGKLTVISGWTFKSQSVTVYYSKTLNTLDALKSNGIIKDYKLGLDGTFTLRLDRLDLNCKYNFCVVIEVDNKEFSTDIKTFTTLDYQQPEMVDLGLSVKWASFNLGAARADEYGGLYQWAGTQDITDTEFECPYHIGDAFEKGWTKYIPSNKKSYWAGPNNPDNKIVLDSEDDAAHVKLGGKWRIPTELEMNELINNCTWESIENYNGTGIRGKIVTSKLSGFTDKSIFLPAAGEKIGKNIISEGGSGNYYSSSLNVDGPYSARILFFNLSFENKITGFGRDQGASIRPVSE